MHQKRPLFNKNALRKGAFLHLNGFINNPKPVFVSFFVRFPVVNCQSLPICPLFKVHARMVLFWLFRGVSTRVFLGALLIVYPGADIKGCFNDLGVVNPM